MRPIIASKPLENLRARASLAQTQTPQKLHEDTPLHRAPGRGLPAAWGRKYRKALVTAWMARLTSRVLASAPCPLYWPGLPRSTRAIASVAQQPVFRLLPIASVPRERRPAGRLLEA